MAIAFPLLLLIFGTFALYRASRESRVVLLLVMLALAIRLFFSVLNLLNFGFPYGDTTDIAAFLSYGEKMAGGNVRVDVSQSYVWAAFIGIIRLYTGDSTLSPLIINSVAGTYVVVYGYRISNILAQDVGRAFRVAAVLAVMPPLVFMSATYLRDMPATLFFTIFAYNLLRFGLQRNPPLASLVALMLSSVFAALLHGAFVLLPAFVLFYMAGKSLSDRLTKRSAAIYATTLTLMFVLVFCLYYFEIGASKVGALYANSTDAIEQRLLDTVASGMMSEQSAIAVASPPLFVVLAILKFLFSPFFSDQLRAFDVLRYPIVVFLFISFACLVARVLPYPFARVRVSFGVMSVLLLSYCFLFAIGSLDADTAFRHYLKLMPLLIAVAAPLGGSWRHFEYSIESPIFRRIEAPNEDFISHLFRRK